MSEVTLAIGVASTIVFTALSFTRIKLAETFRDFAVFIASVILAIASTFAVPGENALPLASTIFLYVNAIWYYGFESLREPSRKPAFNPAASRAFIGVIFFLVATWICFSGMDVRIALIIVLSGALLGAYKIRKIVK
ncbi:MAG: hypothetical protein QXP68_07195 [Thermosphaera sp.]